jgi:cytoskeletal protein CcmA (bactofilin family)
MKKYRLMAVAAILALVGLVAAPVAAHAAEATNFRSGTTATVAKDEVVDATAYLAGSTVSVAGTVKGDLYCAGQNVDITGTVEGDVICAGQTVNISGNVLGNVRVAGQTVSVAGPVARSLTAFGQTVTLTGNAVVNNDVTIYGSSLQLGGKVGRDATIGGQTVTVAGTVGRTVTAQVEHLTLSTGAHVGGGLDYTSNNQVEVAQGAMVTGQTQRHDPPKHQEEKQQNSFAMRFWGVSFWFGTMLVMGLVLLGFAPRTYKTAANLMVKQGGWALLAGIVTLIMGPVVAVLAMATIIGIPVGIAFVLLWVVALMASFVYSGYTLGEWVATQASWKLKWPNASALALGLVLLSLLMLVPVVGGLFGFLALVWGLGGITLTFGRYLRTRKAEPKKANA